MVAAMAIGAAANTAAMASRRGEGMGSRVRARVTTTSGGRGVAPLRVVAKDFPKPDNINKTDNYKQGEELSNKFKVRWPASWGR